MGLKGYNMSSRRRTVTESPIIPRYSLAGPFKGHLSMKSSPYCTGSSSRLCDQYLIQDHMASHYNKILSAKATVDCSKPKSMITSIKYSDQQRRERLKKEVTKYEQEILSARSLSRASSRPAGSHESSPLGKSTYLLQENSLHDAILLSENGRPSSARSLASSIGKHSTLPTTTNIARETAQKIFYHSYSDVSYRSSTPRRRCPSVAYGSTTGSLVRGQNCSYKAFQDPQQKTYSGDLLEKHSRFFKEGGQPFTPRTLKKESKSVLAQYRYYTPPRRKAKAEKAEKTAQLMVDGGTQTDLDSFQDGAVPLRNQSLRESQWVRQQAIYTDETWSADELEEREVSFYGPRRKEMGERLRDTNQQYFMSREEELKYLEFIADVTNEMLTLGLFSNRVLERVFDRHIEQNKHRLDEGKMHHLLDVLKEDLGCRHEESFSRPNGVNASLSRYRRSSDLQLTGHMKLTDESRKKQEGLESKNLLEIDRVRLRGRNLDSWHRSLSQPDPVPQSSETNNNSSDCFAGGLDEAPSLPPTLEISNSTNIGDTADVGEAVMTAANSTDYDTDFENTTGSRELENLGKSFSESLHVLDNDNGNSGEVQGPLDKLGNSEPVADLDRSEEEF
nr:PREDICTED: spermatogenesis-associated protein 7 isoform X2 [Latimeria chalumnae]|eukprot:XP_014341395.1 PREDICTED: spermatogenesis-associated protein 7 isoform X2 [Latimeria chalumnae]